MSSYSMALARVVLSWGFLLQKKAFFGVVEGERVRAVFGTDVLWENFFFFFSIHLFLVESFSLFFLSCTLWTKGLQRFFGKKDGAYDIETKVRLSRKEL